MQTLALARLLTGRQGSLEDGLIASADQAEIARDQVELVRAEIRAQAEVIRAQSEMRQTRIEQTPDRADSVAQSHLLATKASAHG